MENKTVNEAVKYYQQCKLAEESMKLEAACTKAIDKLREFVEEHLDETPKTIIYVPTDENGKAGRGEPLTAWLRLKKVQIDSIRKREIYHLIYSVEVHICEKEGSKADEWERLEAFDLEDRLNVYNHIAWID